MEFDVEGFKNFMVSVAKWFFLVTVFVYSVRFFWLYLPVFLKLDLLRSETFWVLALGPVTIFGFVYARVVIWFWEAWCRRKKHLSRVIYEQGKIKEYLHYDVNEFTDQELNDFIEKFSDFYPLAESVGPYANQWYPMYDEAYKRYLKLDHEKFKSDYERKQEELLEKYEANKSKVDENKSSPEEKKWNFMQQYEDMLCVSVEDVTVEQTEWLKEEGFKEEYQWDLFNKCNSQFLIRPRHNEGLSHAFIVGQIKEWCDINEVSVEIFETRGPDLVINGKWAIEVETGKVLSKSKKKLEAKVKQLNKDYDDKWFFVVTNKNLLSKYRKFGLTIDRSKVEDKLNQICGVEN